MSTELCVFYLSDKSHLSQVTSSFKSLVARNPDLCLNFIKEVSLSLSNPSLPEATDPDGNAKGDADFDCPEPSTTVVSVPSLGMLETLLQGMMLSCRKVIGELAELLRNVLCICAPYLAPEG